MQKRAKHDHPQDSKENAICRKLFQDDNRRSAGKLPVIVLVGSRDAGKTTLLNHILQEQHGKKFAVIENVRRVPDSLEDVLVDQERVVLDTGCIRCTVRKDLVASLGDIAEQVKSGQQVDGVLIELIGAQYPAPVMQTFFVNAEVEESFFVDNVVCLVDAEHAMQQLDESTGDPLEVGVACAQIAFAGTVLLNKIDLAKGSELAKIESRIKELNSTSNVLRCQNASVSVAKLSDVHAADVSKVINEVAGYSFGAWSKPKTDMAFSSVGIRCRGLLNMYLFQRFLDNYIGDPEVAMDFIRIKAVLNIAGSNQKFVVHCIHMLRNQYFIDGYESNKADENKIIFTGLGMKARSQELTDAFKACLARPLRFKVGATVRAKTGAGDGDYEDGRVVKQWNECFAYGIQLFNGEDWQAPHDVDRFVRAK
jgi:G3E family GTPase